MNTVVVGLIRGRHAMPVEEYIFNDPIANVHDYAAFRETIYEFINTRVGIGSRWGCGINQNDYTDVQLYCGKAKLIVYVTGLTSVVAELIAACFRCGVALTLMNYDIDSGTYKAQPLLRSKEES